MPSTTFADTLTPPTPAPFSHWQWFSTQEKALLAAIGRDRLGLRRISRRSGIRRSDARLLLLQLTEREILNRRGGRYAVNLR